MIKFAEMLEEQAARLVKDARRLAEHPLNKDEKYPDEIENLDPNQPI